jgi:hypothetical protein
MLSARDAAERAVHHVTAMTGRTAECVIGIERLHPDGASPSPGGGGAARRPAAAQAGEKAEQKTNAKTAARNEPQGEAKDAPEGAAAAQGEGNGEAKTCGEGGWRVVVEVVETHRIPNSADILATYQAEIDEDGELISYRRLHRYLRGRTATPQ